MQIPEGYYSENFGPLTGRDWVRGLPEEERRAFARVGFAASGYGVLGGLKRAATAKRDRRGRFAKGSQGR